MKDRQLINKKNMNNCKKYRVHLIITGIFGLVASLLMYLGDMLLYFTPQNFSDFEKELLPSMANISFIRLKIGGILGILSACLFIIGFYHIYLTIQNRQKILAKIVLAFLSTGIIFGGAYHAFFPAYGIVAKFGHPEIIDTMTAYTYIIGSITFFSTALGWIFFAYLIVCKKTLYPHWILFFTPLVWLWLSPVFEQLPQPYFMLIVGGWSNLVSVLFFTVSLLRIIHKKN